MRAKALVAGLCLVLTAAGCTDEPENEVVAPAVSETPSPDGSAPPSPEPAAVTTDLRYRVRPQTDKLFSVTLPSQPAGGTLVTWSAFLSGVGAVASPAEPLKAECYVVQSTGPDFDDRVFYLADDSSVSTGFDISLSGSGVVDTADGEQLTFECELDENRPQRIPGLRWETFPQQPIQVTLTPVDSEQQDETVR